MVRSNGLLFTNVARSYSVLFTHFGSLGNSDYQRLWLALQFCYSPSLARFIPPVILDEWLCAGLSRLSIEIRRIVFVYVNPLFMHLHYHEYHHVLSRVYICVILHSWLALMHCYSSWMARSSLLLFTRNGSLSALDVPRLWLAFHSCYFLPLARSEYLIFTVHWLCAGLKPALSYYSDDYQTTSQ